MKIKQQKEKDYDALDKFFLDEEKKKKNIPIDKPNFQSIFELNKEIEFKIPKLPIGRTITITIYTTWGDKNYVGLSGFEIFDDKGNLFTNQL